MMQRTEDQLDDRSRKILRELISRYCMTGEPVGSRTLSKRAKMNLSAATIRNVLSDLEELGYIRQPHTSAGRVPTDKGYRFYVNHLLRSHGINALQREIIENNLVTSGSFEDLLNLTALLLSRLSHNIALAVIPDLDKMTLENMDFMVINRNRILAILITKGGVISNKVIEVEEPITQDELVRIANYIKTQFCNLTLPQIRFRVIEMMKQEQIQYDRMIKKAMMLSQKALETRLDRDQLLVIGASQIVNYPEFSDLSRTRDLLEALEQKSKILHILNECIEGEGIHIVIGSENADPEFKGLSLVSSPYKYHDQSIGTLGILGPTRMEYGRIIPLVDHIAKVITNILSESK